MEKVHVRPHFKSGSKLDIKNYRPIAMITFLYLVFEKYVYKYIKQLIQKQLCNEQHGFRISQLTAITKILTY